MTPAEDQPNASDLRPADFARLLLAITDTAPRTRARDQQADTEGDTLRRRVLRRLVDLEPPPEQFQAALVRVVAESGPSEGPIRGVCTSLRQEWEMARLNPAYRTYLIAQAVQSSESEPDALPRRRRP